LKDQQAEQLAVRNGFKSRSEVVSELGYDAEEIDAEIAADNERADSLGLILDSDPRKVAKTGAAQQTQSSFSE
jgi:capsid protein